MVGLRPVVGADRRFVTMGLAARAARTAPTTRAGAVEAGLDRIALRRVGRFVPSVPDGGTLLVILKDPIHGWWPGEDAVALLVTATIQ